jgi:hypothetical protein
MRTEIIKIKGDWQEVVDDCRTTVGKGSLRKEPSNKFKREILISEHSPIRDISIKWRWVNMPHWVTVHWVRHKWEKFVETQRTDRTGIDRTKLTQDEPQNFTGEANAQHLIDTMRKRLCYMASSETRKYAEDFKAVLHEQQPELSDVLVPNCVYRCGCPEMKPCGWYEIEVAKHPALRSTNIQERYDTYNEIFKAKDSAELKKKYTEGEK